MEKSPLPSGPISNAQILTALTPVEVIAAPGANNLIYVRTVIKHFKFGSAAFVGGGDSLIEYDSALGTISAGINYVGLTASEVEQFYLNGSLTRPDADVINRGVQWKGVTANPTVGTGCTMDLVLLYYIIPLP